MQLANQRFTVYICPKQVDYTIILHNLRGLFFIPIFKEDDTMAKRKKYPKLPNGYGSIKRLSGKNRTNPYGVYPPTKEFDLNGIPVAQKAICYVDDWYKGFTVLTWYRNGEYYEGRSW